MQVGRNALAASEALVTHALAVLGCEAAVTNTDPIFTTAALYFHGVNLRFGPLAGTLGYCEFPCLRVLCVEKCEIARADQSGARLSGVKRQVKHW